ncbi:MAG: tetratricopeptide repeat protein [Sphingomonadaceae bacterium]
MARPPVPASPESDPFIREVDEEYRRDEMQKFMGTWGRWILLAVGVALLGFGAYLWWQNDRARRSEAATEQLLAALEAVERGDSASADEPLAVVAETGTDGQRALARLTEAGLAANRGEPDRARALFDEVAADARAPAALRDLARIRALRLQFDSLSPDEVLVRAGPYLEGDSPWFPAVAELAAVAHVKAGRDREAAALFLRLARSPEAPETQRARAEQMAAYLGEDTSGLADELRARTEAGEATTE